MNKNYTEKDILKMLKEASQNIVPSNESFDVLLSRLDTSIVKPNIYTKPIASPLSIFKLAGAFTAFVLVVLGVRNISTPLENSNISNDTMTSILNTENSDIAVGTVSNNDSGGVVAKNTGIKQDMTKSLARNTAPTPETSAIESAIMSSLAVDSTADSELLALSSDI
jgi:hypothetical protein